MLTYIPNNFVWWLFTIFFISLDFIFLKILFTVLSIVRFIDKSMYKDPVLSTEFTETSKGLEHLKEKINDDYEDTRQMIWFFA